jgi:hypothetical protein
MVAEELVYLRDEWRPKADAATVRRISPLLRSLLVDGQYARAWHAIGLPGEPYISASDLGAALGRIERTLIQIAFAPASETVTHIFKGMGKIELKVVEDIAVGEHINVQPGYPDSLGPVVAVLPRELVGNLDQQKASEIHIGSRTGTRLVRGMKLSVYLASPAALIKRVAISRQDVIQFVANKLGGVHYDPTRNRKHDDRLALLDAVGVKLETETVKNFSGVYAELLSIAENLSESGDLARFLDMFEHIEPPSASGPATAP